MSEPDRSLRVFLCHASADKPAVRELYRRLEDDGVDAWLDSEDLIPGQNWQVEIPNAVENSDIVLVCLSENSVNKEGYVQKEITFALNKALEIPEGRIFLIPVRLDDCDVPRRLNTYQWVDLFSDNGYERLLHALKMRAEQIGAEPPNRKGWLPKGVFKPVVSKTNIGVAVSEKERAPKIDIADARSSKRKLIFPKSFFIATIIVFILAISITVLVDYIYRFGMFFPYPPGPTPTITKSPVILPTYTPAANVTSEYPIAIHDSKGVEMVLVPEGEFTMGSEMGETDEHPAHKVFLDSYYIDTYEVTNALYEVCVDAGICDQPNSSHYKNPKYSQDPIVHVDWNMARVYCLWRDARLPTEAEWEKAARGTDERIYPWGEGIDHTFANFDNDIFDTIAVGTYHKGVSPYGVWDMAGNAREWVSDWYAADYYSKSPGSNPIGPDNGDFRVHRGGSWGGDVTDVKSFTRFESRPDTSDDYTGFRCTRSIESTAQLTPNEILDTEMTPLPSEIVDMKGVEMVLVPEGRFVMGTDKGELDERPAHLVFLDTYYLDKYEVTNAAYKDCFLAKACDIPNGRIYFDNSLYAQYPVTYVSWNMAKTYCEWRGARLPTEAEWEKAARGTDGSIYPWGNIFDGSYVNFCDSNCSDDWADKYSNDGYSKLSPVGSYPNGISHYGAYDMAGNVWEWVLDWYSESYYSEYPIGNWPSNPSGPSDGELRVIKGGAWISKSEDVRSAVRDKLVTIFYGDRYGFRCARTP